MDLCKYAPCEKPALTKGLCSGHYQQHWRGKELTPLGSTKVKTRVDDQGRVCTKCSQYKTWDNYYTRKGGYRPVCKPCTIKQVQDRAKGRDGD